MFMPLGFFAENLGASAWRASMNSPWSEKVLDTRPALMSASALARRASMMSPLASPVCRRTAVGMVTWPLFLEAGIPDFLCAYSRCRSHSHVSACIFKLNS